MKNLKPIYFPSQLTLRRWFEKNHKKAKELLIGYYKISSGKPSVTWSQSVDEALCFGWIDGIRKSMDEESYSIRFTPRNPKSNWSAVNIKKVDELTKLGLMKPEGLALFNLRDMKKPVIYSYENPLAVLDNLFENKFKANKSAWEFFNKMAPSYQKIAARWVMSAKQEKTKLKRLNTLISDCEAERKIKPLDIKRK